MSDIKEFLHPGMVVRCDDRWVILETNEIYIRSSVGRFWDAWLVEDNGDIGARAVCVADSLRLAGMEGVPRMPAAVCGVNINATHFVRVSEGRFIRTLSVIPADSWTTNGEP